ncbi:protein KRI1 homolog [Nasonia vitripennis]|uniref:Protein KRI1 homolog n=1 Tax=Nasonia vitripennis TaxID=7425 RepID=A0A7M7H6Q7_NASVI|nr:protein KRI1 homolog [Nasonia vitripennis]
MQKLFKNDDSDSEEKLNINTDYATNYDNWRQKEELHKLKARYGEDAETLLKSDEDSSESSEDDEGEEIPEEFEKNFYKTLACLKNKDPRIYDDKVKFFDETDLKSVEGAKKEKKEKSLFLRDYERKIIVERGGKYSDSEDEVNENEAKPRNPTYVQEQQELKESFKKVLEDQEDDLLLKPKTKSKEEKQKEEEAYKEWLKGQKKDINKEQEKELKPLRDFWTDPNLDANEKFLRDYVLNNKFLDKESVDDANLDYEHIAHDSDENLSEDERNINTQEEFEHKYNFRFEEPDQEFIKRYPRTLENSLRKKDTRRAQKRAEVKARKEEEKLKKREELKELKALKRKEIEEKIEKLKEITGNDDLKLGMMDLEGDFDPDEYDKKMSQIFNEDYYAGQEEDAKPEFPDIDEELQVESTWDDYEPGAEEISQEEIPYHDAPHCEDPEFNMDADYNGQSLQEELVESTKKRKKRRRSKFAELISKEKPKFDPTLHPSYQEYYDQYYALDYEDMIGDLPCRFKYRQVVPNDYGLTVEEILMADDRELNKWCSLKKALEHKPEYKELNEVKIYKHKAANEALKKKILKSLYSAPEEETPDPLPGPSGILPSPGTEGTNKSRKRKRKNKQNGEINAEIANDQQKEKEEKSVENGKSNAKKSKKFKGETESTSEKKDSTTESNLTEENNKPSSKKKIKLDESTEDKQTEVSKKKKKKKKTVQNDLESGKSDFEHMKSTVSNEQSKSKPKAQDTVKQCDKTQNVKSSEGEKMKKKQKNKNNKKPENGVLSKKQQRRLLFLEKNKQKNKKDNKGDSKEVDQIASLSAERLKAYGLNPKKFKNKLKYMKKD